MKEILISQKVLDKDLKRELDHSQRIKIMVLDKDALDYVQMDKDVEIIHSF